MLESLKVQNLSLLESQELTFSNGFTVITGESGSGKSIIFDCLDALFGGGNTISNSRLLSPGKSFFQIEAVFSVTSSLQEWLEDQSIFAEEDQCVISREWRLKDDRLKSRCRVNGIHVNLSQINSLRPFLLDFTFQGQAHQLNSSEWQLKSIDRLLSSVSDSIFSEVETEWKNWINLHNELLQTKESYQDLEKQQKELLDLLEELNIANIDDPSEEQSLKIEQERLLNDVTLNEALHRTINIFRDGNNVENPVLDQISLCIEELKKMHKYDSTLATKIETAYDIFHSTKDLVNSLDEYHLLLQSEPDQLNNIQERLYFLQKLQQKHSLDLPALINMRNELRNTFFEEDLQTKLVELECREKNARDKRDKINQVLSLKRHEEANRFEQNLQIILKQLGFSNIRFQIQFKACKPQSTGSDAVVFLFSANPGQPLLPLSAIASGGEMSRFLLAMKIILLTVETPTTLIFDEIDSGVSGRISKSISTLLKNLSSKHQVFCVTHQPLIAANAEHHFSVTKNVVEGKTSSTVKYLDSFSDRQKELAELAGGDLEEANLYAASLLEQQAA